MLLSSQQSDVNLLVVNYVINVLNLEPCIRSCHVKTIIYYLYIEVPFNYSFSNKLELVVF